MDQCRFRRRAMGRERPGRGEGGSPHRGQICSGGEKGSYLVDILHVHAQGSSSGEWPAESKKSEKSQDPPRSLETYNGRTTKFCHF